MMGHQPAILEPLSFSQVLDKTFRTVGRNFVPILVVMVVCYSPFVYMLYEFINSASELVGDGTDEMPLLNSIDLLDRGGLLITLYNIVVIPLSIGAASYIVGLSYIGKQQALWATLRTVLKKTPSLVAANLIFTFGAIFILLGVQVFSWMLIAALGTPAIFLIMIGAVAAFGFFFVSYSMMVPALVLEESVGPLEAFGRSWKLAAGNRWRIFFLFVVTFFLFFILIVLVQILITSLVDSFGIIMAVNYSAILVMFGIPIVLVVVIYYDMRVRKEGLDLELLEKSLSKLAQGSSKA